MKWARSSPQILFSNKAVRLLCVALPLYIYLCATVHKRNINSEWKRCSEHKMSISSFNKHVPHISNHNERNLVKTIQNLDIIYLRYMTCRKAFEIIV